MLAPHLTGRHVYMATPPQGHPCPAWDDLIAAFHDHGILPDDTWREVRQETLGRDYRRRVRARLLEIRKPLRQSWDDFWLRRLGPWSPPSHLPHTCHLCGECDTVSSAAPTGANRCARCSQVAACPWPEPPAGQGQAQLRTIARYDPPGGTSLDDFLHHMLQLGDSSWELRNHWLEQLLREPLSAAARVHR